MDIPVEFRIQRYFTSDAIFIWLPLNNRSFKSTCRGLRGKEDSIRLVRFNRQIILVAQDSHDFQSGLVAITYSVRTFPTTLRV